MRSVGSHDAGARDWPAAARDYRNDGVVVLSPDAGAYEELHDAVLPVHPFDIEQGGNALHTALVMPAAERAARAAALRALAAVHTPRTWLDALLTQAR